MLSEAENKRISQVGAGTPMGEALRRYWLPACLAEELPAADGAPIRVRLLGEDLIAFRTSDGAIGLVDAFCPHRRAPMFFGRNEECGLRCVYHGWKFDRSGACVDMPSLRQSSGQAPPPAARCSSTKVRIMPRIRRTKPGGASCGPIWVRPKRCRQRPITSSVASPPSSCSCRRTCSAATGCRRSKAGSTLRTRRFCTPATKGGLIRFLAEPESLIPRLDVERTDSGY